LSTTVRLGSITPAHRAQLDSIVRATGVFNDEEIGVALELFDESISTPACGYEFVGAFHGDRLVGYACYGPTPSTDHTFDLYWIAVHPIAQRSGGGGALMSEVERRLQARRARLVVVETSSRDSYEPTRRFYEKRGYENSARVRDFYGHGDDRVILTKTLMEGRGPNPESRVPLYE
jgi:ribosomal protein S18 acetylase RimI-like enzyme